MSENDTDGIPGNGRRGVISDVLPFSLYFVVLPVFTSLLLCGLLSGWTFLNAAIVVSATLVAAIYARFLGFTYMDAIPVWGTVALLVSIAIGVYDDYSARRSKNAIGTIKCSLVPCETKLQLNKALELTAAPLHGLSAADLRPSGYS